MGLDLRAIRHVLEVLQVGVVVVHYLSLALLGCALFTGRACAAPGQSRGPLCILRALGVEAIRSSSLWILGNVVHRHLLLEELLHGLLVRPVGLTGEARVLGRLARRAVPRENALPDGALGNLRTCPQRTTSGALVEVLPLLLIVELCSVQVDAVARGVLAPSAHQANRTGRAKDGASCCESTISRPDRVNILQKHHLLSVARVDEALVRARQDVFNWKVWHAGVGGSRSSNISL